MKFYYQRRQSDREAKHIVRTWALLVWWWNAHRPKSIEIIRKPISDYRIKSGWQKVMAQNCNLNISNTQLVLMKCSTHTYFNECAKIDENNLIRFWRDWKWICALRLLKWYKVPSDAVHCIKRRRQKVWTWNLIKHPNNNKHQQRQREGKTIWSFSVGLYLT